ncbi:C-C motif chemokine 7-like [Platichthys flesus]|uniref:C-C motif chemokine 7-like n=1 Tax=Platichthys flesus TaxID=8260 RepID=UPI002DBF601C|nr:C-C motif chemokine 7-like [Platichthys flesus]
MEAQISETTFTTSSVSGRTMKMLLTLVPLTLICLLLHVSAGPMSLKMMQDQDRCCKGFNVTLIPKKSIKDVRKTYCDKEAILITTKKDKMFCYDPSSTWAQNRLSDFQKSL